MKQKKPLPYVTKPLPIVILAIDPGKEWGGAVMVEGSLVCFSKDKTQFPRTIEDWVVSADNYSSCIEANIRLVIVAEKWVPFGKFGFKQCAGLNAEWGKWLEEIEKLPKRRPAIRIVRVYPQTWRSKVLGGRHTKDEWKEVARRFVKAKYHVDVDHNTAEAICIARWASMAPEVAAVLSKKERGEK